MKLKILGKNGDTQNYGDDGQNNADGQHNQLGLCPVAEGIFPVFVAAPEEEHDQINNTAEQRDAGNQAAADPAADGYSLFGMTGTVIT